MSIPAKGPLIPISELHGAFWNRVLPSASERQPMAIAIVSNVWKIFWKIPTKNSKEASNSLCCDLLDHWL